MCYAHAQISLLIVISKEDLTVKENLKIIFKNTEGSVVHTNI